MYIRTSADAGGVPLRPSPAAGIMRTPCSPLAAAVLHRHCVAAWASCNGGGWSRNSCTARPTDSTSISLCSAMSGSVFCATGRTNATVPHCAKHLQRLHANLRRLRQVDGVRAGTFCVLGGIVAFARPTRYPSSRSPHADHGGTGLAVWCGVSYSNLSKWGMAPCAKYLAKSTPG
jgi:hypothetical protein